MSLKSARGRFWLVVALLAGVGALPSRAQAMNKAAARTLYNEGTAAYNLDDFPKAIEKFRAAYKASGDPALLYNIAQSYRLAKDPAQAISFYRKYLRSSPANAPNRGEAELHIKEMEALLAEASRPPALSPAATPPANAPAAAPPVDAARAARGATSDGPPAASPPPPATTDAAPNTGAAAAPTPAIAAPVAEPAKSEPARDASGAPAPPSDGGFRRRLIGWSIAGAGVVAATVGLIETLGGQSKINDAVDAAARANAAHDAAAYQQASNDYSSGTSQRTLGRVALVVGGLAFAGGLALALTAPHEGATTTTTARLSPWLAAPAGGAAASSAGLALSGSW
jgi:tetratricopeptide (TPR) repeat protein